MTHGDEETGGDSITRYTESEGPGRRAHPLGWTKPVLLWGSLLLEPGLPFTLKLLPKGY